jgi:hypothetical protein
MASPPAASRPAPVSWPLTRPSSRSAATSIVPGYGVAFAGDTGGGIKGRFIDLGYDEGALKSWRGTVDVYYLGPPPAAEDIRWVLP